MLSIRGPRTACVPPSVATAGMCQPDAVLQAKADDVARAFVFGALRHTTCDYHEQWKYTYRWGAVHQLHGEVTQVDFMSPNGQQVSLPPAQALPAQGQKLGQFDRTSREGDEDRIVFSNGMVVRRDDRFVGMRRTIGGQDGPVMSSLMSPQVLEAASQNQFGILVGERGQEGGSRHVLTFERGYIVLRHGEIVEVSRRSPQ